MLKLVKSIITILSLSVSHYAIACGECEYSDNLGICWPYDKCVVKQLNPVEQGKKIVKLAVAIGSGDSNKIKESLGDVLVNSPTCLACRSAAHTVLPNLTDAQINTVVGEGFLVFVGTGDPYLVTIDVAQNIATQQKIERSADPTPAPIAPPPKSRKPKTYKVAAECLLRYSGNKKVYAAWRSPSVFTGEDAKAHQFPDIDLIAGDTIVATSPVCPTWHNPAQGQESLTSAKFKFEDVSSKAGAPEVKKWFVYGPELSK
jgi:hypothetical protein